MRAREPAIEIAPGATVSQALRQMSEADVGRLLVMQGGRLAGLVTRSAIARYVMLRSQFGSSSANPPAGGSMASAPLVTPAPPPAA
jgi:CBS domain-containing protein